MYSQEDLDVKLARFAWNGTRKRGMAGTLYKAIRAVRDIKLKCSVVSVLCLWLYANLL